MGSHKQKSFYVVEPVDIPYDLRFDLEYNWNNYVVPNVPEDHTPITVFNWWGGIRGWRFVKNAGEPCNGGSHI